MKCAIRYAQCAIMIAKLNVKSKVCMGIITIPLPKLLFFLEGGTKIPSSPKYSPKRFSLGRGCGGNPFFWHKNYLKLFLFFKSLINSFIFCQNNIGINWANITFCITLINMVYFIVIFFIKIAVFL